MNPATAESAPEAPSPRGLVSLAPLLDAAWKLSLFCSIALYTVGLVISNIQAELFGRSNLGLDKASYIVVGLVWAVLSLGGFWMFRRIRDSSYIDSRGNTRGRIFKWSYMLVQTALWAFLFNLGATLFVLWIGDTLFAIQDYVIFLVVLGTGAVIDSLVRYIGNLLAVRPFSIFAFGESHNVSLIVRYASPIPIVLIFYSAVVFPMIPTAFGGGSMNAAEVFIKPDKEKALQRAGLSIGQNGSLGAWRIVAELPDAIVLTNRKLLFPPAPSRTIWVRKDDIEALIYVSAAKLAP